MLVFWLLGAQGWALDLGCDRDCTEIGFESRTGLSADAEGNWPAVRWNPVCKATDDSDIEADWLCNTRFDMAYVDIGNDSIRSLSKWWMIIAMVSLAFVGFFYLHWESLKSVDDVLPEDVDERRQNMAKALADVARDHSPG